jgi:hypothetical protein
MKMIWQRSEINDHENYRLHLCQSDEGKRFFRLIKIGTVSETTPQKDVYFISAPVPNNLLKMGDVIAISEVVRLDNGDAYFVDDHGIWLTDSECKQMDSGLKFNEIQWVTDRAPKFPPR